MNAELIFQPFGLGDASTTLGARLVAELSSGRYRDFLAAVAFATSTGTSRICESLKGLVDAGGTATVLCGISNGVTSRQAVSHLLTAGASVLGLNLGGRNILHQKVYRFLGDTNGLLVVGSNNLTADGLFRHFEASVVLGLDPRVEAERDILTQPDRLIAWVRLRHAANLVQITPADLDRLTAAGDLLDETVFVPRVSGEVDDDEGAEGDAGDGDGGVPTIVIPPPPAPGVGFAPARRRRPPAPGPVLPVAPPAAPVAPIAPVAVPPPAMPVLTPPVVAAPAALASVVNPAFPTHFLFAPGATSPTLGAAALSGRPLPNGAPGIIVRVSGDTARIFAGKGGTANMTFPVGGIETLRFGIQGKGRYAARPRAEFDLRVRFIGANQTLVHPEVEETNVMPYGYLPGEVGNKDTRMLIPGPIRDFGAAIRAAGLTAPVEGDFAFVEWPTATNPEFRLSFLERGSALAGTAQQRFITQPHLADNAVDLPPGLSPNWP